MSDSRKICAWCGRAFKPLKNLGERQKCCSSACSMKAAQVEVRQRRKLAFSSRPNDGAGKHMTESMVRFVSETAARYPLLTRDGEAEMIAVNKAKRDHLNFLLVMHNVKFIRDCADEWCGMYSSMDGDDLFMIGIGAMWRAAQQFNPETGVRFITYAGEAVKNEMRKDTWKPEFARERLTTSLDVQIHDDSDLERSDVVHASIDPSEHDVQFSEWIEHRDLVSFAREILDMASRNMSGKYMETFRRWANGCSWKQIANERGVSHQCVAEIGSKVRKEVMRVRDRALSRYGERSLCATTDWNRIASTAANRRRRTVRVEHRGPAWRDLCIAFERYKLTKRYARSLRISAG